MTNRSPRPAGPRSSGRRATRRRARRAPEACRDARPHRRPSAPTPLAGRRGRRSPAGCGSGSGRRRAGLDRDRPRDELQLVQPGVGRPVGPHEAVGAEVRVVRLVAEVARRSPSRDGLARHVARIPWSTHSQTKPPWRRSCRSNARVVARARRSVAHRVGVLAEDQRTRRRSSSAPRSRSRRPRRTSGRRRRSRGGRPTSRAAIAPS